MLQTKFVIASHSYLLNRGLVSVLKEFRNVEVVEIVENINSFESVIEHQKPDYLLIASDYLKQFDPAFLNTIFKLSPSTEIIRIETQKPSQQSHFQTFDAFAGKKTITEFFINLLENRNQETDNGNSDLSDREKVILAQVAMGKANKEIADELNISIHTVITHRKNITAKLGIKSISGLTVYAIFNGLISMDDVE